MLCGANKTIIQLGINMQNMSRTITGNTILNLKINLKLEFRRYSSTERLDSDKKQTICTEEKSRKDSFQENEEDGDLSFYVMIHDLSIIISAIITG